MSGGAGATAGDPPVRIDRGAETVYLSRGNGRTMRILVAVKETAEATPDLETDGPDVARRYREYGLNEWDEHAIEAGVRLSEAADDVDEVVSVTIGPDRAEEAIRTAIAKGVDRAIRVWDDDVADATLDVAVKTRLLAAVAETEEPDLILTGVQASDDANGATGVSLADELGVQWAAVVNQFEIDDDRARVRVHRELENGVEEVTEIDLPAVLTIQLGINEPRAAAPPGSDPKPQPIERRGLADLGLDASALASPLRRTGAAKPEAGTDTTYIEGDPDEQAARLADVLRDEEVTRG